MRDITSPESFPFPPAGEKSQTESLCPDPESAISQNKAASRNHMHCSRMGAYWPKPENPDSAGGTTKSAE